MSKKIVLPLILMTSAIAVYYFLVDDRQNLSAMSNSDDPTIAQTSTIIPPIAAKKNLKPNPTTATQLGVPASTVNENQSDKTKSTLTAEQIIQRKLAIREQNKNRLNATPRAKPQLAPLDEYDQEIKDESARNKLQFAIDRMRKQITESILYDEQILCQNNSCQLVIRIDDQAEATAQKIHQNLQQSDWLSVTVSDSQPTAAGLMLTIETAY